MPNRIETSIAVVGAGPAGLAAALSLTHVGAAVVVVAPRPSAAERASDTRTFAALGGSVDLLQRLGVLARMAGDIAPLRAIRLIDVRGGIVRAPEVLFDAREAGLAQFGYNIPQATLIEALAAEVAARGVTWIDAAAKTIVSIANGVTVATACDRTIEANLITAADGRKSIARAAAGIQTTAWQYPQAALTCVFGHSREHEDVSTEFHGTNGPLTTVPLPDGPDGPRSSLVWVDGSEATAMRHETSDGEFRRNLAAGLQGLLGSIGFVGPRAVFPLSGLEVASMAQRRIALIGEAGHVLPPIGAQGLNLGLRDAATIADCVAEHGAGDPGRMTVIATYAQRRRSDVWSRVRAVDLLNRSLLSSFVPLEALRGLALHAMSASSTLRRAAMHQGLEPIGRRPRLMLPMTERVTP